MKLVIGVDLGGTNVKGIIMGENGEVMLHRHASTADDPEGKWRNNVLELVEWLKANSPGPITGVGMSAPGLANKENSAIAHLPNRLYGLENYVWGHHFQLETFVLNDAHAALMAEAEFGVIKGYKNAILLTLGTGVGGGILINGELYQGQSQMAGHLGHLALNVHDDERSILGIPGSLEYAMGNYAIKRRSFGKFHSTHALVEAYRKKDHFATWLWLESIRNLAIAIASLSNALSPEILALSGGITMAGDDLFNPLEDFLSIFEFRPAGKRTLIKKAKFQELSGAIGAAAFALKKMNGIGL